MMLVLKRKTLLDLEFRVEIYKEFGRWQFSNYRALPANCNRLYNFHGGNLSMFELALRMD